MASDLHKKLNGWPAVVLGVAAVSVLAFYVHRDYKRLEGEKLTMLSELETARTQNYELIKVLVEKEKTLGSLQGTISDIANTVGTLEKLAQTDEELLKKYSKVYFLNENYVPAAVSDIDDKYLLPDSTNFYIYAKVWPYLRDLLQAAERADMGLKIASAYRSFGTQATLKSAYKVTYGSGANTFSADQGYSEHQLGTALDFTTTALGPGFSAFGSSPAYQWLIDHAHEYGFILSYPEDNAFYKFEPWHWRFVGRDLAKKLHAEGKHFYDLDQRDIDEYLIKLFE